MKLFLLASNVMLALFLLCADSCRAPNLLMAQAEAGIAPQQNFFMAAKLGQETAPSRLGALALELKQDYWLGLAANLGDAESSYQLAMQQQDKHEQNALLTQAAKANHPMAQYELALQSEGSQQLLWLQKAAEQQIPQAQIMLARWWRLRNEPQQALPWLQLAAEHHGESALALGRYYWNQQQRKQAVHWWNQAKTTGNKEAATRLSLLNRFFNPKALKRDWVVSRQQCLIKLEFVATGLDTLMHTLELQRQFKQDKRLAALPICLKQPMVDEALSCSENWNGQRRLGCNLSEIALRKQAEPLDFSHLVVVAEKGKANVNNGVMYLDLADSYSVFVHELAHFVGFVDEYPVSDGLAEQFCHPWLEAPNLIYVPEEQEPDLSQWLKLGYSVQLTPARTCNNASGSVYKPASVLTFMEYHDQQKIPALYLALWQQRLSEKKHLVPAYINLAQASEEYGSIESTLFWQQRYLDFYLEGESAEPHTRQE